MPYFVLEGGGVYYSDGGAVQGGSAVSNEDARVTAFNTTRNAVQMNIAGFISQLEASLGDPLAINAMMKAYPGVYPAIDTCSWSAVQVLLIDALQKGVLTQNQYTAIQLAATTNNIPVTL